MGAGGAFVRRRVALLAGCLAAGLAAAGATAAAPAAAFGRAERGTAALVGIFYDLKQTQQRTPVANADAGYAKAIDEFLVSGLDEAVLNRFFRAGAPLYATQIATGSLNADAAPKAFGVDGVVKPRCWVVHYKGQVAPPEDGVYRFAGLADDVLAVAVNGRVVLVGNLPSTKFWKLQWRPSAEPGPKPAASPGAVYGDWFEARADRPVDIDILIGERPGGIFHALLLYQRKGGDYPVNARGQIVLPLFQVEPQPIANPRFLTDRAPWKCVE